MKRRENEAGIRTKTAVVIGENIRAARHQRGWSSAELARRTNIAQPTLNSYEQGTRSAPVHRLIALAEQLEVSITYLLSGTQSTSGTAEYQAGYLEGWNAHERAIAAFNDSTFGVPSLPHPGAKGAAEELPAGSEAARATVSGEAVAGLRAALEADPACLVTDAGLGEPV